MRREFEANEEKNDRKLKNRKAISHVCNSFTLSRLHYKRWSNLRMHGKTHTCTLNCWISGVFACVLISFSTFQTIHDYQLACDIYFDFFERTVYAVRWAPFLDKAFVRSIRRIGRPSYSQNRIFADFFIGCQEHTTSRYSNGSQWISTRNDTHERQNSEDEMSFLLRRER